MPEQDPVKSPEQSRFGAFIGDIKGAIGNGIENISNGIEEIKQGADRLRAIGKIAGLGAALSLGLVGLASAEEPVKTPNVPTAEAGASLKQTCVDAGLDNFKVKKPMLGGPKALGGDGTKYRNFSAFMGIDPMPPECEGSYVQFKSLVLEVESPKKPNVYDRYGSAYALSYQDNEGFSGRLAGNINSLARNYPKCVKGPRKFRARFVPVRGVKDADTDKLIARKIDKPIPIKVKAAC